MEKSKTSKTTTKKFEVVSVPVVGQSQAIVGNLRFVAKLAKCAYTLREYILESDFLSTGAVALPGKYATELQDFLFEMLNSMVDEDDDVEFDNN